MHMIQHRLARQQTPCMHQQRVRAYSTCVPVRPPRPRVSCLSAPGWGCRSAALRHTAQRVSMCSFTARLVPLWTPRKGGQRHNQCTHVTGLATRSARALTGHEQGSTFDGPPHEGDHGMWSWYGREATPAPEHAYGRLQLARQPHRAPKGQQLRRSQRVRRHDVCTAAGHHLCAS